MRDVSYNLSPVLGETYHLEVAYKPGGVVKDLTGYRVKLNLANGQDYSYIDGSPEVAVSPHVGLIVITLSSSVVAELATSKSTYRLSITDLSADPGYGDTLLLKGRVLVQ